LEFIRIGDPNVAATLEGVLHTSSSPVLVKGVDVERLARNKSDSSP
jgi:hypothetical protein